MNAHVEAFFDPATYLQLRGQRPETRQCAVIDSVLDYDPASGRTSHAARSAWSTTCATRTCGCSGCWKPMCMPTI